MTKDELEKLRGLKTEIGLLNKELRNLPMTKDSVKGSMAEFPYIQQTIVIKGIDEEAGGRLQRRLSRKLDELQDEMGRLEDFLDEVEDPDMRAILRLKYRNGLTHIEIAAELGYCEKTIQRKLNEFWETCPFMSSVDCVTMALGEKEQL